MAIKRVDEDGYNPRYGATGGRVRKKDFSIDGKSWEYRNPENFNEGNDRGLGTPTYNRDAYEMTNPLYDYSYGQARDAAKALGIGNVNNKEEVTSIIEEIQNSSKEQTEEKIQTVKKTKPTEKKDDYMVDVTEQEKQSKSFANVLNSRMIGNTTPLTAQAVNPTAGMKADTPAQEKASNMAFNAVNSLKEKGLQLSSENQTMDKRKPGANDFYNRDQFDQYVSEKQKENQNGSNNNTEDENTEN